MMSRIAVTLGLALTLASCGSSSEPDRASNVILVTLDTTRPDFFGSYGAKGNLTPNLDALAAGGARFSMAVSSSSVTPVSHASILTGQNPYEHGLRILAGPSGFRLPEGVPTLATTLKQRGYTTAAIHSAFPVSRLYGFDRDFDLYEDLSGVGLEEKKNGKAGWDVAKGQRRSDRTTQMVLDYLAKVDEPFFLWIHYWDPHDMEMVPDEEFMSERPLTNTIKGNPLGYWREMYGFEISYVDKQFGRVLDALKSSGQYDNTMIAVISDHGEGLDDGEERHGWRAHRILYQEQIHVPLILRFPGGPSGVVIDDLVRSIDVLPTLLDYLDVAPLMPMAGESLRNLMEGRADKARVAYADQINLWDFNAAMVEVRPKADLLHMAMDRQFKLIYRPSFPEQSELYDYRTDPGELEDLFHQERGSEPRKRLLLELAERAGWVLEPFPVQADGGMSKDSLSLLGDLGYAEGAAATAVHWDWLCPLEWTWQARAGSCPQCASPLLPARKLK